MLLLLLPLSLAADGDCIRWSDPEPSGAIDQPELAEISGLVASRGAGDHYWAHADSGNEDRLYALTPDGALLGLLEVTEAENEDWEDIAAGPCPAEGRSGCACLFLADIGDNELERDSYALLRVTEPDLELGQTEAAAATWFTYPDGRHDAEALLMHPLTGEALVITKADGPSGVYAFEQSPPALASTAAPEEVTLALTLDAEALGAADPEFTGGDVSPDGRWIALRTPGSLLLYPVGEGETLASALAGDPEVIPAPDVELGEAVAFSPDGDALLLGDEGAPTAALWTLTCEDFEAADVLASHPMEDCTLDDAEEDKSCGCAAPKGQGPVGGLLFGLTLLATAARRSPRRARRPARPGLRGARGTGP